MPQKPEVEEEEDDDDSSGWETDNGTDDEGEGMDYNEDDALPATSCLFCPQTKSTKAESLEHMRFHHGFVIPDQKYLVDEDGLLKYLGFFYIDMVIFLFRLESWCRSLLYLLSGCSKPICHYFSMSVPYEG